MNEDFKSLVVYQIYPRSYCDSNGDGIGDINGIRSKLHHLVDLGIDVIWLSPVYASPNDDNGYDISDYVSINPEYGTMEDMELLIKEAASLNIRIIMDLVMNHTSNQHEWFKKSIEGIEPYTDYYIWKDGNGSKLPNNWTSFFSGPAWEFNETRGQYFLHLFSKKMPDLNFANQLVVDEFKAITKFWLDKGIFGFRCDVVNLISKTSFNNGKFDISCVGKEHFVTQTGCHLILQELQRDVFEHYNAFIVGETVLTTTSMAKDLCEKEKELDMIFSFEHMETDQVNNKWFKTKFKSEKFFNTLTKWQEGINWNANYLENHDQPRAISRFANDNTYHYYSATMLNTLLFTLRGTPYLYQGEEIGMTNCAFKDMSEIRDNESIDIYALATKLKFPKQMRWKLITKTSRDNARTPMQWDNSHNAGFSENIPWLKVNPNYEDINVEDDKLKRNSVYEYTKSLINLRKTNNILIDGTFTRLKTVPHVFGYTRTYNGATFIILLNFSASTYKLKIAYSDIVLSNYHKKTFTKLDAYEAIIFRK